MSAELNDQVTHRHAEMIKAMSQINISAESWTPDEEDEKIEREIIIAPTMVNSDKFQNGKGRMSHESRKRMEQGLWPLTPEDKRWVPSTASLYRTASRRLMGLLQEEYPDRIVRYRHLFMFGHVHLIRPQVEIVDLLREKIRQKNLQGWMFHCYQKFLRAQKKRATKEYKNFKPLAQVFHF